MCGSSNVCPQKYLDMAFELGQVLAINNRKVIYGGGAKGLMSQVADGALAKKGQVDGYIPKFMIEVEWQHTGLNNLYITKDMSERKKLMMDNTDATIFLPGGCGTMEEFFEWFSSKRLGKYSGALIIVNYDGYYDPLMQLLANMQKEKFHNPIHDQMWSVCSSIKEVLDIIDNEKEWSPSIIKEASAK